ncbi:baseplate J/gp47 family protein [Pseudomonas reactans]|nr:baseplate J/gp47 family protein [Pseudomonas reactans]
MGFKRPSLPELIERIDNDQISRLPGAQAVLAKRMTRILAAGEAGVAHGLYGYLQWLEKQLFPETCDDDLLHLHSAGVPRRPAAAAAGFITVTGTTGVVLDASTQFQVANVVYVTTASATIVAGTADVAVSAVLRGVNGYQAAGTQLTLVSPVGGINANALVRAGGITGGADLESFDSWRDRIMLRRARTPRGGAEGDWAEWALEVSGVTRAWEAPMGMGVGSVVVWIVADDAVGGPLPSQVLLDAVFAHINSQRNVTSKLYVVAPLLVPFKPQIRVIPDTTVNRVAIDTAMSELVYRAAKPGGTLLISQIRGAISSTSGVTDYELVWPVANIQHTAGQLPIWGGVQWLA